MIRVGPNLGRTTLRRRTLQGRPILTGRVGGDKNAVPILGQLEPKCGMIFFSDETCGPKPPKLDTCIKPSILGTTILGNTHIVQPTFKFAVLTSLKIRSFEHVMGKIMESNFGAQIWRLEKTKNELPGGFNQPICQKYERSSIWNNYLK